MYTGKRKWALTPGVLALTHKDAICSIDEFNLYKGDYGEFQNAMETGEVFINKVVKGKVITDAPVLAVPTLTMAIRKSGLEEKESLTPSR